MNAEHVTLAAAAKQCPGRPSSNAVWRWCRKGVRSRNGQIVRLEHIRVGGRIFTTPEALQRFFQAVAQADAGYFESASAPICHLALNQSVSTEKRLAAANKSLDEAGF